MPSVSDEEYRTLIQARQDDLMVKDRKVTPNARLLVASAVRRGEATEYVGASVDFADFVAEARKEAEDEGIPTMQFSQHFGAGFGVKATRVPVVTDPAERERLEAELMRYRPGGGESYYQRK